MEHFYRWENEKIMVFSVPFDIASSYWKEKEVCKISKLEYLYKLKELLCKIEQKRLIIKIYKILNNACQTLSSAFVSCPVITNLCARYSKYSYTFPDILNGDT